MPYATQSDLAARFGEAALLQQTDLTGTGAINGQAVADALTDASALIANPQALHGVVAQDYAQRWEGLESPSLEEVEAFCGVARIVVTARGGSLEEHLVELDIQLKMGAV